MPRTARFGETDSYNPIERSYRSEYRFEDSNRMKLSSAKESYLQIAMMTSSGAFSKNWSSTLQCPPLVRNRLDEYDRLKQAAGGQSEGEFADVDFAEIADLVSASGEERVRQLILTLLSGSECTDALRKYLTKSIHEVFARLVGSEGQAQSFSGEAEGFLKRAIRLDGKGHVDAALDLIYDSIDEMLLHGNFAEVDMLLSDAPVNDLSVDLLLGLLTATLPARSKLTHRLDFLNQTRASLCERGELEEGLLSGLE